ncbi:zf-HC2 domain-containing protein [Paraclostridium ghonii]|uniref:zf-HC2 domain-containing protein n=1 Tax=Paraclostridium ghonii TaxID=29358 RepID=UPI00202CA848|nr:zf-HC2 domain-containing protein [Paeniclostridium ghonii]MCM0167349.1 zf-HC2 domain-containing protein [Paeniclostridium ghonii]
MRCYDKGVLQAYIDGELSPLMMKRVAKHLGKCKVCQMQFDELIDMNELKIKLEKPEIIQNSIDVEDAWDKFNYKLENKNGKNINRGAFSNMNKMKKFITVSTASLVLIAGVPVIGTAAYNAFKSHVLEDDIVNKGLVHEDGTVVDSTKNGKFIPLDKKITDKNITLHLTDLYVAESRVSINYRIEDEKGNLLPVEYDTEGLDLKYDGIVDGKQVEAPEYYLNKEEGTFSQVQFLTSGDNELPIKLMKDNKFLETGVRELGNKNEVTITFAGYDPIEYPVNLNINISKIGKVVGSWQGQIEINAN